MIKYKNDAKVLNEYLTKLPSEKVASRELYIKFENRYRALPRKYRELVTNIEYLDNYYDKLIQQEKKVEVKQNDKQDNSQPKKKNWFWNKG